MSIIEVARIQVRRGQENQTGIPQLAGGEFAWAADTEKLYIGLRREDGGSRDANVEILTENSARNLFTSVLTTASYNYIYREESYITAVDGNNETIRTIQERLDDSVSVKAFGAVGDGQAMDYDSIQIAVDNLFLNALDITPKPDKILKFPAGVYNINNPLHLPKNAILIGEGKDKTIINVTASGNPAFQTVDSKSAGLLLGSYITFEPSGTIDSVTQPDYVYIQGMTIQFDPNSTTASQSTSLINLDCANYAVIKDVKFKGITHLTTNTDYCGVNIRGYSAITSEHVLIENCDFEDLNTGIKSNYDIIHPIIRESRFEDLQKGISFCDPIDPISTFGPRFASISTNIFKNISQEAIYVGTNLNNSSTFHISSENKFFNVGNSDSIFGEDGTTGTSVITFLTGNNKSINDYFGRYEYQLRNPGASIAYKPLVSGNTSLDSFAGAYTLIGVGLNRMVIRLPLTSENQFLTLKYSASGNQPVSRKGFLKVNIGNGESPNVSITDEYDYTTLSDGNIIWSHAVDSANKWVEIRAFNGGSLPITIQFQSNLLL